MTDRELAGCACPMCGAPVTVERRAMFSGNEEAMASGIPDDYVERYTYRRAPSSEGDGRDAELSEVTRQLIERDQRGRAKYGATLDRADLSLAEWLQHMAEELMDGAGYALAAKRAAGVDARDAERYRWLRENAGEQIEMFQWLTIDTGHGVESVQGFLIGEQIDEAIDAAIAASAGGG